MAPVEGLRVYAFRRSQPGIGYVARVLTTGRELRTVVVEWRNGKVTEEAWGKTVAPCQQ